jgi:uncharacterized protein YfaQ (DUF2300 family)
MKKRTLTATAPDGTTITRTTARTYSHAVVFRNRPDAIANGADVWSHYWCGRPDLLPAKMIEVERLRVAYGGTGPVVAVEVNQIEGGSQ